MDNKKEYLIELFLKCSLWIKSAEKSLKENEDFLRACFQSTEDAQIDKIMTDNGMESFREKLISIIGSNFTEEEIKLLISFYRSDIGKKVSNMNFLLKIEKSIHDIFLEREKLLSKMEKE